MKLRLISDAFNRGVFIPLCEKIERSKIFINTNFGQTKTNTPWTFFPVYHFVDQPEIKLLGFLPILFRLPIKNSLNMDLHHLFSIQFLTHLTFTALIIKLMLLQFNLCQLYLAEVYHQLIKLFRIISYNFMSWTEEFPGFLSVLSSLKNLPIEQILGKWQSKVQNGHIKRLTDNEIQLPVFQICGVNINKNFIALPSNPSASLKIKMPILVLLVKNLDKYFRFEIGILDNKNVKRTFISCNKQSITRIKPFQCSMPLELDQGWNQIVFNLEQYCDKAFGTHFVQCQRIQINANCRVARVYFNDTVKTEEQIPAEYKLFMRVQPFKS